MSSSAPEFEHLQQVSATIGADPLLVQGAGGNTSVKINGVMWIKASGTWLMNAVHQQIMVPVRLDALRQAMQAQAPEAERAQSFVVEESNPHQLRPSIETTLHALFPQKVVIHVHCVNTIALAIQQNAPRLLAPLLSAFNWRYVPYAKPGLDLSTSIAGELYNDQNQPADVVVLGNHGLVVAGHSVDAAQQRLTQVCRALQQPVLNTAAARTDKLTQLADGSNYELPRHTETHAVALHEHCASVARGGSLYPDHVIFLGPGSVFAAHGESAADVAARCAHHGHAPPVSILFPGNGVLMKQGAGDSAQAMARCLSDVCVRVAANAQVNYLTADQNHELIHWDAEKYRQTLNHAQGQSTGVT